MSSELYDKFAKIHRIDQAIYESEQEISNGAEAVDADTVFAELEKKYFGFGYISAIALRTKFIDM